MKLTEMVLYGALLIGSSLPGAESAISFKGEPQTMAPGGRRLSAVWQQSEDQLPTLIVTVENTRESPLAELAFEQPLIGRNRVVRKPLRTTPGKEIFHFTPQLLNGGNPHAVYHFRLYVTRENGAQSFVPLQLTGPTADPTRLGAPQDASGLADSRFGVCTHFGHNNGPWKETDRLLDAIAKAGFKYIRDDTYTVRNEDGSYSIRPWDLDWITRAHERGLKVIPILPMRADEPLEEFLAQVEGFVKDTKDLIEVYELGNEPANFGNWRGRYNGSWNGKEADNSTSTWVLEHLRYSNAAAERIKELRPDAIVIGIGNAGPANLRALDAGVSPALDGIVDHTYTFSLPPEKLPFGLGLYDRDGVKIGNETFDFDDYINSYEKKFAALGRTHQLWITEFGFSTYFANGKNENGLYAGYTEETQAVYLVRRLLESAGMPIIRLSAIYDFIDDGSDPGEAENNFGLMRADYSAKPALHAMRRLNSLLAQAGPASDVKVTITAQPLHRAGVRSVLVQDWDRATIPAGNEAKAVALTDARRTDERMVAVWSTLPAGSEFNSRSISLEVELPPEFQTAPLAIDPINGDLMDVPWRKTKNKIVIENLILENHPLILKFFATQN